MGHTRIKGRWERFIQWLSDRLDAYADRIGGRAWRKHNASCKGECGDSIVDISVGRRR